MGEVIQTYGAIGHRYPCSCPSFHDWNIGRYRGVSGRELGRPFESHPGFIDRLRFNILLSRLFRFAEKPHERIVNLHGPISHVYD